MTVSVKIAYILRTCGVGKETRILSSSVCFAVITFFYFFVIGSGLQLKVFSLQHRVTYENVFSTHLISINADIFIVILASITWYYFSIKRLYTKISVMVFFSIFLILSFLNFPLAVTGAGLTLPTIIFFISIDRFRNNTILRYDSKLSLDYVALVTSGLCLLGVLSLIVSISSGVTSDAIEKYPYAIFQQLLSTLTPMIMAILVFCVPFKVLLNILFEKIMNGARVLIDDNVLEKRLAGKRIGLYLLLCILLGTTLAFLPHLSEINPNHERLGVDTPRYTQWLDNIGNQTSNPVYFTLKASGDRPLTLIILFFMKTSMKLNTIQAVEYSPLILTPLLILVTFFLARQLTSNDIIAVLAAFLTSFSFQMLVGIYSGYYANWLALILGYFTFGLVLTYLKGHSKFPIVALGLTMTGLLLAHVYTWTIMIAITFVFLLVLLLLNYYPRKRILLVYLVLSSSIAVDVLKSSWVGSSTGLEADVSVGRSGLGLSQFADRLKTLVDTVQTYYGGVYGNIAILGLGLYWLIRCNPRDLASIFLLIFMSSALVPLFIGDWVLQSRVLYEIPFQIPASIAFSFLLKGNHKVVLIGLLLIAFYLSLHIIVNLGFVPAVSQSPFSKIISN